MPAMIELLGVGAPREGGGWRLHRICATFRRGEVTVVVSHLPEESDALLDAVAARILPEEGRVWIAHVPVSRATVRRIRGLVAEVDVHARPVEHRSLLWNVLVAGKSVHRALHGLLRLPRKSERLAARRALERVGLGGREVHRPPLASARSTGRGWRWQARSRRPRRFWWRARSIGGST